MRKEVILKSSKLYLYIPVEISTRELHSRFIVAAEAAARGYEVFLAEQNFLFYLLDRSRLPKGIVFHKSATPTDSRLKLNTKLKGMGFILTSCDEESGLLEGDYAEFAEQRFSKDSINLFDAIFCWGKRDFKWLTENYSDADKKFYQSGNPRIDLWRNEARKSIGKDQLVEEEKVKILFVSNFDFIFNREEKFRTFSDMPDSLATKTRLEALTREHRYALHVIHVLTLLIERNSTVNIVFRPHPTEDEIYYERIFMSYPQITVDSNATVSDLLKESDIIIHHGSTTAIEAYFARKPTIFLTRCWSEETDYASITRVISEIADNADSIERIIERVKMGNYKFEPNQESANLLKERLPISAAAEPAYNRIVDVIDSLGETVTQEIGNHALSFWLLLFEEKFFFLRLGLKKFWKFAPLNNESVVKLLRSAQDIKVDVGKIVAKRVGGHGIVLKRAGKNE